MGFLKKEFTFGKVKLKGYQAGLVVIVGIGAGLYIAHRQKLKAAAGATDSLTGTIDPSASGEGEMTPDLSGGMESTTPYGFDASASGVNPTSSYTGDLGDIGSVSAIPATPSVTTAPSPILVAVGALGGATRVSTMGVLPPGYHWTSYPWYAAPNAGPGPARSQPGAASSPQSHKCPQGFHFNGFTCVPNR